MTSKLMSLDIDEILETYVKTLYKVVDFKQSYSYLDAEIINRKISNIIFKQPVTEMNFDTVSYRNEDDHTLIDSVFDVYELFIRSDIHKTTGITYTEYMNMTPLEVDLLRHYVNFKMEVTDIDARKVEEQLNAEESSLDGLDMNTVYGFN